MAEAKKKTQELPNNLSGEFDVQNLADTKLPYDLDVEKNVLNVLLMSKDARVNILDQIKSSDFFYFRPNQTIFDAIIKLYTKGDEIDPTILANYLKTNGLLDEIGGVEYLKDIATRDTLFSGANHYAKILKEYKIRRNLIDVGDQIKKLGYAQQGEEGRELIDYAQVLVNKATDVEHISDFEKIDLVFENFNQYLEDLKKNKKNIGIFTPFTMVNKIIHGFKPGQMIVVGARPSMGKSTLLLELVRDAAFKQNQPTVLFSLEDEPTLITAKLLAAETGITTWDIENSHDAKVVEAVTNVEKQNQEKDLFIDASPDLNLIQIRTKCRRIQSKLQKEGKKLGLICVDYLQLVKAGERIDQRHLEVAHISRSLKALARELHCPVIVAAQLNRNIEDRNSLPRMSDLKESGQIEQDADIIFLLHRQITEDNRYSTNLELLIEKNRSGQRGERVLLDFELQYSRIRNKLPDQYSYAQNTTNPIQNQAVPNNNLNNNVNQAPISGVSFSNPTNASPANPSVQDNPYQNESVKVSDAPVDTQLADGEIPNPYPNA